MRIGVFFVSGRRCEGEGYIAIPVLPGRVDEDRGFEKNVTMI
jgi:hypothetical protein